MCRWGPVALAAAVAACGSSSSRGGGAPPPLAVRWIAHLHEARAALAVLALGEDAAGDRYVLYWNGGAPGATPAGHLQKRGADGTTAWDVVLPWVTASPDGTLRVSTAMVVTAAGNVLFAVGVPAPGAAYDLDLGDGRLTLLGGPTGASAIVKYGADGHRAWSVVRDRPTGDLATDAQGSAIVTDCVGALDPCRSVASYRWDGTLAWAHAFPVPPFGVRVAPDGAGGAVASGNDAAMHGSGGFVTRLDATGDAVWTRPFEHFATVYLTSAAGGAVVGDGWAEQNARYDGAPVGVADGVAFALAADGTARGFRARTGAPLAASPAGDVLWLDQMTSDPWGLVLRATTAAGEPAWETALPELHYPWSHVVAGAYDGAGSVTVAVEADVPFDLFGTRIVPYDAQSPVIVVAGPR